MQAVQLQVDDEIKALGDMVEKEIADIKAKLGTSVYIGDALPALISLASGYAKLPAEIKRPDNIAYLFRCIADVVFPVAPAA